MGYSKAAGSRAWAANFGGSLRNRDLLRWCGGRRKRANERGGEEFLSACGFHCSVLSVLEIAVAFTSRD